MKIPKLKISSFKTKLIVLISLAFVIAILTGTIYAVFAFRSATIESARETLTLIAEDRAELIGAIINNNYQTAELTALSLNSSDQTHSAQKDAEKVLALLHSGHLPDELIMIEYQSVSQKENNETDPVYRQFMYKQSDGSYGTEDLSKMIDNQMPVSSEIALQNKSIFQSPDFITIGSKRYYVYSIASPLSHKDKFSGYLRLFYSMESINDIFNTKLKYKDQTKFSLISEKEHFLVVSEKEFLAGKDIYLSNTTETTIYQAIQDGKEKKLFKDITIGFAKVQNNYTSKQWLLTAYIPNSEILRSIVKDIQASVIFAALILIISLIITFRATHWFFQDLTRFSAQAQKFAQGENKHFREKTAYEEINTLAHSLNTIIQQREKIIKTAEAISNENYLNDIQPISEEDSTAHAINTINRKLQEIESATYEQEQQNKIRNWQRKGQLEIAEVQRTGNNKTESLSLNLIRTLVKYTDALLGAIYVRRSDDDGNEYMELTGAYAYEEKRSMNIRFNMGENIVGTCALEQKKIYLDNLPDNYIKIGSGMGSSKPGFLAIFPIFTQKQLVAVSEIGFMKKPKEHILNFIEQLGENIGSWLSAAENQKQTEKLLNLSQEKTRELSEKEAELDSMLKAINRTVLSIQYAPDGRFITANELYYQITGYQPQDLEGSNVIELVKDQKEELLQIIERVKSGESVELNVIRYSKSGNPISMKANYSPYYNSEGKITRIIFFGIEKQEEIK